MKKKTGCGYGGVLCFGCLCPYRANIRVQAAASNLLLIAAAPGPPKELNRILESSWYGSVTQDVGKWHIQTVCTHFSLSHTRTHDRMEFCFSFILRSMVELNYTYSEPGPARLPRSLPVSPKKKERDAIIARTNIYGGGGG